MLVKLGVIQTTSYASNEIGMSKVAKMLARLGKNEADVVCLPEQWLADNKIDDFEAEFSAFKKIAKEYSMSVIPGAFYEKIGKKFVIAAPIIGESGEIIGKQEKIHPFDYEKDLIRAGTKTRVFSTRCKFGVIICYDMVFAGVAESLVKKGAQVLFSPARIVRRGISSWHLYVQTRALENRVPILAANMQNSRFGGKSIVVDLKENDRVMVPDTTVLIGQSAKLATFDLKKYEKSRKIRYSDSRRFS